MSNGSLLTMNALPRERNLASEATEIADDVLFSPLNTQSCAKVDGGRPIIRLVNAHWNGHRANELIAILRRKQHQGCDVRVLLGPGNGPGTAYHDRLLAQASSSESPVSVVAFNKLLNPGAGYHVKYALIEQKKIEKSTLMFGSMSITKSSHDTNDEIWNVWTNPTQATFEFYRDSFDRLWTEVKSTPVSGTDSGTADDEDGSDNED